MAQATVGTNIHEPFDAELNLRTKRAFYPELLRNKCTNGIRFLIAPVFHFLVPAHTRVGENLLRPSTAYAIDVRETYFAPFAIWNINA